ncbi:MAG: MarR family winged helix-turn-helix transcriptional regulator [Bdellovibrionota bacterium]
MTSSPAYAVLHVSRVIENSISEALKDYRLNSLQAGVLLSILFEQRQVRPRELSRAMGVTPSNLSHIITSLEKKKWLFRKTIPGDARGYGIELSDRGKKIAGSMVRYFDRMQARSEALLTEEGTLKLVKGLERMRDIYAPGAKRN